MKQIFYYLTLCLFLITYPAKAEFSESEEQQIQHIIEKYLSQNPELLFDLIVNYSNQKSEDAKQIAMSMTYDSEGDGTMGNPDASFIIYEYSDYNCGYCKRLFNTLQTLISEDDDLLIVVKEFPILAKSSVLAAKAALAAEEQGRFAEYHNALMTSVGGITQDSLQSIATMVGLDLSLYNEAISSNRFDKILQRNMNAGRAIGIEGTPALLIGEQIIPGAIGLEEIKALIKAERENS
ncbi:MAG: thioredoxin domain-containing protein [Alphaproteobacteria bacterium]|nr:thioredoxin domain-containing protein [Alphaproteobacteria bacterium]